MAAVEGIDVSNHQGTIDWNAVSRAGKRLAFIKATEGTFFRDKYLHANMAGCERNEMWRGAYHFARPGRGPTGADEANFFCDWVLTLPQLEGDMYVVDLEQDRDQPPPGTDIGAHLLDFCQTVVARTSTKPLIYSSTYVLQSWKCDIPALAEYALWLAGPGMSAVPQPPANWSHVPFWQYNWYGHVPGVPGNCDLDYFMGKESEMYAYGFKP